MLTIQIRELAANRAFIESAKNAGGQYADAVDEHLSEARRDPVVKFQLGSNFQHFVTTALGGEEIDPGFALQAFWSQWDEQQRIN